MPRQNPRLCCKTFYCGRGLITQFLTLYQAGQYPPKALPCWPSTGARFCSTAMRQSEGSPA